MTVHLVGAGPGVGGLTERGAALLRRADVVLYDAPPTAVLDLAPAGADRIAVGIANGAGPADDAETRSEGAGDLLVAQGRTGRCVVRLGDGDPFGPGRAGAELRALAAAGVPFEVVPAAAGPGPPPGPGGAGAPGASDHVTIVSLRPRGGRERPPIDWGRLARAGGTLVALGPAARAEEIAPWWLAAGRDPGTPVVVVASGVRGGQPARRVTLGQLACDPALAVGAVAVGEGAARVAAWSAERPLIGRTVLVTRAAGQAGALVARLAALGAHVLAAAAVTFETLAFTVPDLAPYSWVVFASANAVRTFVGEGLAPAGLGSRALASARLAAVGPGTQAALARHGLRVDLVPPRALAEGLLSAMPPPDRRGARVLLPRAERGRDTLPVGLAALGYDVDVLPVYRTAAAPLPEVVWGALAAGDVDLLTFASPSTVDAVADAIAAADLRSGVLPPVATIGPVTSAAARARGLRVAVEAEPHTIDGLADAARAALEPDA